MASTNREAKRYDSERAHYSSILSGSFRVFLEFETTSNTIECAPLTPSHRFGRRTNIPTRRRPRRFCSIMSHTLPPPFLLPDRQHSSS